MTDLALISTPLEGLSCLQHRRHDDQRGAFSRIFCEESMTLLGYSFHVRQINHSLTRGRGSVRGMHYQYAGAPEAKLITCLHGVVWDVALDLRAGSPTFLHWHAERLEAGDGRSLLVPPGFAHGFQTLTEDAELLYLHSADYAPTHESGVSVLDPRVNIGWPLPIINLSERDKSHALLGDTFTGISL